MVFLFDLLCNSAGDSSRNCWLSLECIKIVLSLYIPFHHCSWKNSSRCKHIQNFRLALGVRVGRIPPLQRVKKSGLFHAFEHHLIISIFDLLCLFLTDDIQDWMIWSYCISLMKYGQNAIAIKALTSSSRS